MFWKFCTRLNRMDDIDIDSQLYFPFYKLRYIHLPRWCTCTIYIVIFAMIRFPLFSWPHSHRYQLQHTQVVWYCIVIFHCSFEIAKILGKQKSYWLHFGTLCDMQKHKYICLRYIFLIATKLKHYWYFLCLKLCKHIIIHSIYLCESSCK